MSTSKQHKINTFDPSGVGQTNSGIFGLPFTQEEADIVIAAVPWDVTTSYKAGTSNGPEAVLAASPQLDLYDPEFPGLWKAGIYLIPPSPDIKALNAQTRKKAKKIIDALERGSSVNRKAQHAVNSACEQMNDSVYAMTLAQLRRGKQVALLGGDHSTPLGFFRALSEVYDDFGILQIDAHMDLRDAYEGFTYSHASIMYNALKLPNIRRLVQVGIRDFCQSEAELAAQNGDRITVFYDHDLKTRRYEGSTWQALCREIIETLPEIIHISFDIDGLTPALCPNTGTPVPGGMEFSEIRYLLSEIVKSGRKIIGFDLVEVSPDPAGVSDWDANVGARILYLLCGALWRSKNIKGGVRPL